MMAPRRLIVNADDFGLSAGVNKGIIEAHENGIVTSASLLVRFPASEAAAAYARKHQQLSLGLHFDFGEWTCADGQWRSVYHVVTTDDHAAVEQEARSQLATFRDKVGQDPTHLDSHQHVHLREPARSTLLNIAHTLRIPLRHFDPHTRYCGAFYGQTTEGRPCAEAISVDALLRVVRGLPEGTTELGCHPGYADDLPTTMYRREREREINVLCDPRISRELTTQNIKLGSFREVAERSASERRTEAFDPDEMLRHQGQERNS